jgi:hypothetical protein
MFEFKLKTPLINSDVHFLTESAFPLYTSVRKKTLHRVGNRSEAKIL